MIGTVGIAAVVLGGYGLVKVFAPISSAMRSEVPSRPFISSPPLTSPATPESPITITGSAWLQDSVSITGSWGQLNAAVSLNQYHHLVTHAESLSRAAEAESSLVCRALRYCEAREIYEDVGEMLETIQACSQDCEQSKLRAHTRQAYVEARLRPIANALKCVTEQNVCACAAEAASRSCK